MLAREKVLYHPSMCCMKPTHLSATYYPLEIDLQYVWLLEHCLEGFMATFNLACENKFVKASHICFQSYNDKSKIVSD